MKSFELAFPGGAPATVTRACSGLTPPGRCASSDQAAFDYLTDGPRFPEEGRTQVRGTVVDAVGRRSLPVSDEVRVDRSPPVLTLDGGLYSSRNTILVLDDYVLDYSAKDGSRSSASEERSGARQVRVLTRKEGDAEFVERHATPPADCPDGSCEISGTWRFETGQFEEGKRYTIRVEATDQLGHLSTEEFTVWVGPALGSALPVLEDRLGLEDFWHYDSTETGGGTRAHVNLANGNLLWHSVPVVNPGRGLSSVVNVTYNSQETPEEAVLPENVLGDALGQYNQAGRGFSLGLSGVTRVNEPLALDRLALGEIRLTDADGTRHKFVSGDGVSNVRRSLPASTCTCVASRRGRSSSRGAAWPRAVLVPRSGEGVGRNAS